MPGHRGATLQTQQRIIDSNARASHLGLSAAPSRAPGVSVRPRRRIPLTHIADRGDACGLLRMHRTRARAQAQTVRPEHQHLRDAAQSRGSLQRIATPNAPQARRNRAKAMHDPSPFCDGRRAFVRATYGCAHLAVQHGRNPRNRRNYSRSCQRRSQSPVCACYGPTRA